MVDEKRAYFFGRNPKQCDFVVEHASCSRVHAVLIYHKFLQRFAIVDMNSCRSSPFSSVFLAIFKYKFNLKTYQIL